MRKEINRILDKMNGTQLHIVLAFLRSMIS